MHSFIHYIFASKRSLIEHELLKKNEQDGQGRQTLH